MQYQIIRDRFLEIRPIFEASYGHLLHNKCAEVFEQATKNCIAMSLLEEEGKIAAFCFHREMVCEDWRSPPSYMADSPDLFLKLIEKKYRILTLEWLTVEPSRLGRFTKVQPGDLILGLALKFMSNSQFNAAMGFSRQDTKVDQMTLRFGTKLWGTVERLGIPCSVVFVPAQDLSAHPVKKTQEKINELWVNRINLLPQLERKQAA